MRHVPKPERYRRRIKRIVVKREFFAVAKRRMRIRMRLQKAFAPLGEHRVIDVGRPHFPRFAHDRRERNREVAGTGRNIKHLVPIFETGRRNGPTLPKTMQPPGKYVVHKIVLLCDRCKHLLHVRGLFVFGHRGKTKVRSFSGSGFRFLFVQIRHDRVFCQ